MKDEGLGMKEDFADRRRTDICDCRVAFAPENTNYKTKVID